MKKIAEINLRSITPCSMGKETPLEADNTFRLTELRSLSAWWLRAILGGVAYDNGLNEIKTAIEGQKKIFGSTESSSLIHYRAKDIQITNLSNDTMIKKIAKDWDFLPRVKMLLRSDEAKEMKKRKGGLEAIVKDLLKMMTGVVEIYTTRKEIRKEEKLAYYATILSLLLQGIGKISRRGLGAFYVRTFETETIDAPKISIKKDSSLEEAKSTIDTLLQTSINIGKEMLQIQEAKRKRTPLPSVSVIAKNVFKYRLFQFKKGNPLHNTSILQRIFCRGGNLKKQENGFFNTLPMRLAGISVPFHHIQNLRSFILGLPRKFKRYGYQLKKEELRRASPFIASLLSNNIGIITSFIAGDFPEKINWYGKGHQQKIKILKGGKRVIERGTRYPTPRPPSSLQRAFEIAREELDNLLNEMKKDGLIQNLTAGGI